MGENRLMADLYEENQRLKERIKELEEKHFSECGQIAHYSDELAKAKELLKAAVNDFHWLTKWQDGCELCGARYDNGDCPVNDNTECDEVYVWQHESEALALIGEDGEQNDT